MNAISGKVDEVYAKFGFILGDDGEKYFFIPSYCLPVGLYKLLRKNDPVTFTPFRNPLTHRLRARDVQANEADAESRH